MKKLMILLSAVAFAAVTQAASVDWVTAKDTIKAYDGTSAKGMAVYLLNADSSAYSKLIADLASGEVTASTLSSSAAYLGSSTTGTTTKKAGLVSDTATSATLTSGSTYNLAYLVFDKDGENKDYFYVSSTAQGKAWQAGTETTQELATAAGWDTTSAAGTWTAVAPEPTSGLLMLLGMAGLALKRKRA